MDSQNFNQQPQQNYNPQPQYGYAAQPQGYIPQPNSHMALAIFTTLCLCLPLGIVAILKASKVSELYTMKQYDAAIAASNDAKKWCMYGIIGWVIWLILVCIIYAVAGVSAFAFLPGLGG